MTAAIFGLIGVIVGGLITGGIDFALQRRNEGREVRRAKRLVGDEVDSIVVGLRLVIENKRLPRRGITDERPSQFVPTAEWAQNKTVLAGALSDEEWRLLATFYYNVLTFRLMAVEMGHQAELDDVAISSLENDVAAGREAAKALGLGPSAVLPSEAEAAPSHRNDQR